MYAFVRTLPGQCVVVIVNTQMRAVTFDVDLSDLVPPEAGFEDVWNWGRYTVRQQRLHGVTIASRDVVVLVRVENGAVP
jgi:hypothetical protein